MARGKTLEIVFMRQAVGGRSGRAVVTRETVIAIKTALHPMVKMRFWTNLQREFASKFPDLIWGNSDTIVHYPSDTDSEQLDGIVEDICAWVKDWSG